MPGRCIQRYSSRSPPLLYAPFPFWKPYAQPRIPSMHSQSFIHPQCPQGYPQFPPPQIAPFRGHSSSYPHCPQLIHSFHPQYPPVWRTLWITKNSPGGLFTHVAKMYKDARSCMFGQKILFQMVESGAGGDMTENFRTERKRHSQKTRTQGASATGHSSRMSMPFRPLMDTAKKRRAPLPSRKCRP